MTEVSNALESDPSGDLTGLSKNVGPLKLFVREAAWEVPDTPDASAVSYPISENLTYSFALFHQAASVDVPVESALRVVRRGNMFFDDSI